ncbi:hypothetical protein PAXINDRAFT_85799 [Paxillus involutus ATCC 200175]|uniref:Uncharacterized protein n=1 Tax=Paxillus involutus ATCC 200175 TaxID=664439 RepID=A0A0C9T4J9_PAXIN|nr:hypothetical protein PAXINDRAFT_85799 [Paxillus involutus ATCC 200175]
MNQEVETYLHIFCKGKPNEWSRLLSTAEFAHNFNIHSVTKKSPFFLTLRYESHSYPSIAKNSPLPSIKECLSTLKEA